MRQLRDGPAVSDDKRARLIGEMRTLLRDWAHHTDTTLVTLMQDLLAHYGEFDDADHDAAAERRATFNREVADEDRAYDGWSAEPQKRALTPREREIIGRIIRDTIRNYVSYEQTAGRFGLSGMPGGESRVEVCPAEMEQLQQVRWVLDARHD